MRWSVWPQSLFGRLLAASVSAVLLAQAVAVVLIVEERERFVMQGSVREWTRRITDTTLQLAPLDFAHRAEAVSELLSHPDGPPRRSAGPPPGPPGAGGPGRSGMGNGPRGPGGPPGGTGDGPRAAQRSFVRVPLLSDFEQALRDQLRAALGASYTVEVGPTPTPAPGAIPMPAPFYEARDLVGRQAQVLHYDVSVRFPQGDTITFRVARLPEGAFLPHNLVINLSLLLLLLVIVLYLAARSITRPLTELARAADRIGRQTQPKRLKERGARELREAAHAFNTMQDRLRRYLDSRTRVLAAMSHDLKTPLTRLRLQVETLDNPPMQERIGRELDEMEGMVREALSLFRGLDDGEPAAPVDIDALVAQIAEEFTGMGATVTVTGHALKSFVGKAQALKRCLTNLVANAIKFGGRADMVVEDGAELQVRVRDAGPGIPPEELERVFEPFYRLENSRNRDSGGTGLGLSIARDIAQAHGGTLNLSNLPGGGLEALLSLPRLI
jgi:signal transduction histidine kinase